MLPCLHEKRLSCAQLVLVVILFDTSESDILRTVPSEVLLNVCPISHALLVSLILSAYILLPDPTLKTDPVLSAILCAQYEKVI